MIQLFYIFIASESFSLQTLHGILNDIEHFQPLIGITHTDDEEIDMDVFVNILLVGPRESGKSSFVNTLESVFRERTVIKSHDRRSRSVWLIPLDSILIVGYNFFKFLWLR